MNVKKFLTFWSNRNIAGVILVIFFLLFSFVSGLFADIPKAIPHTDSFTITGSEFFQRSQFDSGEIRIFLKNTGDAPLSVSRCELSRITRSPAGDSNEASVKVNYLYAKLTPPLLLPAQDGELLLKLFRKPPADSSVKCTIHDSAGNSSQTTLPVKQAVIWIPYIGFSAGLNRVYVYVRNTGSEPLKAELLRINNIDAGDSYRSINNQIPPGDTASLIFDMPAPLTMGEYVYVSVSAESGTRKWQSRRTVRAVNRFPLIFEAGSGGPGYGLDSEKFFVTSTSSTNAAACIQSMICPGHAHGSYEEAAGKFLANYYSIFSQNQYLLSQMWICRSDRPGAWYKFGPLADIAVMNPVLLGSREWGAGTKTAEFFHPFFWLAASAKKATAPNRYFACIPLNPESTVFLQNTHTPDEIKFLTYCAIASGAKGILYRGILGPGWLSKDGFVRLNKELAQLKTMLMIAEPVDWASAAGNKYIAKSLLCGDEAILVIIFDGRYFSGHKDGRLYTPAFEKKLNPVKIKIKIPYGVQISEIESLYGPLSNKLWHCEDNQLDFTAGMFDSVQIYKLIITQKNGETGLRGPAKPFKKSNAQIEQKFEAIKAGQTLFENLISRYPENESLQNLQNRLQIADSLSSRIAGGLRSVQRKALSDIAELDILPGLVSVNIERQDSIELRPAEQLYIVNLPVFSKSPDIQGFSTEETKLLYQYYNLKMRNYIEIVTGITTQVMITNPESQGLSYYGIVLPLLYLREDSVGWNEPGFLLAWADSVSLDAISDFCLLRVERPKTSAAIARYAAELNGRDFSLIDWSLSASDKCTKNHRPALAERVLQTAIDSVEDEDSIVKLKLKIARGYSICGDNGKAAEKSRRIARDFPDSPLYGDAVSAYFAYLANQSKAQEIVAEIDSALDSPQCQKYLPQLMYLKWWALRKTNQLSAADKIGRQLRDNYGKNLFIAPVLLACATEALSRQDYNECRKLLTRLTRNFPRTGSAKQARTILKRINGNIKKL